MSVQSLPLRYAANVTITAGAIVAASTTQTGNLSMAWDDTAKQLTVTLTGGGIPLAEAQVFAIARGVAATAATVYVPILSNGSTAASYVFEIWNLAATPAVATPNGISFSITRTLGV